MVIRTKIGLDEDKPWILKTNTSRRLDKDKVWILVRHKLDKDKT